MRFIMFNPTLQGFTTYGMQLINGTQELTPYGMQTVYRTPMSLGPLGQKHDLYDSRQRERMLYEAPRYNSPNLYDFSRSRCPVCNFTFGHAIWCSRWSVWAIYRVKLLKNDLEGIFNNAVEPLRMSLIKVKDAFKGAFILLWITNNKCYEIITNVPEFSVEDWIIFHLTLYFYITFVAFKSMVRWLHSSIWFIVFIRL